MKTRIKTGADIHWQMTRIANECIFDNPKRYDKAYSIYARYMRNLRMAHSTLHDEYLFTPTPSEVYARETEMDELDYMHGTELQAYAK